MWAPMTVSSGKSIRRSSSSTGSWQRDRTWGPGMPMFTDTGRPSSAHVAYTG